MKMKPKPTSNPNGVRIGMVNFINTAPLYETWKQSPHPQEWQVVEANPAELNRKIATAEIDLGFISSHEYAVSPEKYLLLDGLSISANGPVGSVFLFSETAIADLDEETVFLSPQSQTSNSLVQIILEEFAGVRPNYIFSKTLALPDEGEKTVLAIGDRALRLKASGRYPIVLDLSEEWSAYTGLPFVFAVWAVRQEFYQQNRKCVAQIHQELLRCVVEGRQNLKEICEIAAPLIPMSNSDCFAYLQGIEYDLNKEKIKALELFYSYLISRDEGKKESLPLKIVPK